MSLFDFTQLGLEKAISGADLRQTAVSENMANVNTPGYQRADVDFHGALRSAMATGRNPETVELGVTRDPSRVVRADGSGLDVDAEAATLAKVGLEHQALVQVARARIDIMLAAMGGGA